MQNTIRRSGFTLIELLIVVAIILILAGILIPVAGHMQEKARRDECLNNVRQWGVALMAYLDDHRGRFPSCGSAIGDPDAWFNKLPPYLGADPLKDMKKLPRPGNGVKSVFICSSEKEDPSLPKEGRTYYSSYAFNSWIDKGFAKEGGTGGRLLHSQLSLKHNPPVLPASFVVLAETCTGLDPSVNLSKLDVTAFRHNHSFNVCFADGHAENLLQIAVWKPGLAESDNYGGFQWNPNDEKLDGPAQ